MNMTQMLADVYDCTNDIVHEDALASAAREAALAVGARIVGEAAVRYVPHGLTIALFLAESHILITTWPEHRLLLIDVLLCNPAMDADIVVDVIVARLAPEGRAVRHIVRRVIAPSPG